MNIGIDFLENRCLYYVDSMGRGEFFPIIYIVVGENLTTL
jgi:hypothetical protein